VRAANQELDAVRDRLRCGSSVKERRGAGTIKTAKTDGSEKEAEVRRPVGQASRRVRYVFVIPRARTHVPHKLYSNNYLSVRKLFPSCDLSLPMHKASPRDRTLW